MSPHLRLLAAGMLFSLGGALIKVCTFPSLERAGLRALVAAVALFVLLPEARRWPRGGTLRILPAYFGATCLFVVANTLTTAANAIFLQSTYPFWVTLLGTWLLREKPRRRDIAVLAAIAVGMSLFFLAPATSSATAPEPRLGDAIALLSGLSYGLLLLGFRWLARVGDGEAGAAVAWGNAFTAPVAFALAPMFGQQLTLGDTNSWLAITALGVLQVGVAYALLVRAIPHVPAVQAALILMIEPALNPLLAYAVHGERPHPLAIGGGTLILSAVLLGSLRWRRARGVGTAP